MPHPPEGLYPELNPRLKPEFAMLIERIRPSTVLEMGSWEGRSALAWLQACQKHDLKTEMICVDTWLGSSEHWLNDFPEGEWSRDRLRIENDSPNVYNTFCNTIHQEGFENSVVALRMTNRVATDIFARLGYCFDLIYVDGAHDFRSVISDLLDALTIVSDEGVVIGDDWGWNAVAKAARIVSLIKRTALFVSHSRTSYALAPRHHPAFNDTSEWQRINSVKNLASLRS